MSVAVVIYGVDVAAGAAKAAMSGSLDDTTSLGHETTATSLVAIGPSIPVGDHAIDGARMSVACLLLLENRASCTTIAHGGCDRTVAVLQTAIASCSASTIFAVSRHNAVDRTVVDVACISERM
jgi:hypothetical protein